MKCPGCKQNNSSGADFCRKCGAPVTGGPSSVELQRALTEALDQQTATSEIMRVISRSPTDAQPVFDAIVQSATRLCDATWAAAFRFDGERQTLTAQYNATASELEVLHGEFPRPLTRDRVTGRAIVDRRVVHIQDIQEDPEYAGAPLRAVGFRTVLAVPMLYDDQPIGVLGLWRREARSFTEKQVDLVSTSADQAVIAIKNVRLFKELEARGKDFTEALEQQTAMSEILRVISRSPTDLQPVLDTIAASAARLCDSIDAQIFRIDGDVLRLAASFGSLPKTTSHESRPINRGSVNGRAVVERRTIHVHDLAAEPESEWPEGKALQKRFGHRTTLATPLLREGSPVGAITIRRMDVRPFSEEQIKLLETFADQAVIAIENVRLFKELEVRNRDLSEALEQQTATSEVLRVISRSAFDLQPVFGTPAENAVRLCEAERAFIYRFDGERLRVAASYNASPELREFAERNPISPGRHSGVARTGLERRTVHIPDAQADPEYSYGARNVDPIRTVLGVPMLKGDELVGVILIYRLEVKPFTGKQTATAGILRVISSSPTDIQPVLDSVAENAARLCETSRTHRDDDAEERPPPTSGKGPVPQQHGDVAPIAVAAKQRIEALHPPEDSVPR